MTEHRELQVCDSDPFTNDKEVWVQVIQTANAPTIKTKAGLTLSGTYYPIMYIPPHGTMSGHTTAVIEEVP